MIFLFHLLECWKKFLLETCTWVPLHNYTYLAKQKSKFITPFIQKLLPIPKLDTLFNFQ